MKNNSAGAAQQLSIECSKCNALHITGNFPTSIGPSDINVR